VPCCNLLLYCTPHVSPQLFSQEALLLSAARSPDLASPAAGARVVAALGELLEVQELRRLQLWNSGEGAAAWLVCSSLLAQKAVWFGSIVQLPARLTATTWAALTAPVGCLYDLSSGLTCKLC
jgi:hypothetical protein